MTGHTALTENKCRVPYIVTKQNSVEVYKSAFSLATHISEKYEISKGDILIVSCTDKVFSELKEFATTSIKEFICIEKRGDIAAVQNALEKDLFVMGGIDYIGGLEFSAVIIVGADLDKFPEKSRYYDESIHFINYSSFNKLYVAITRAKYQVAFISEKTQRISSLLEAAINAELLIYDNELSNII